MRLEDALLMVHHVMRVGLALVFVLAGIFKLQDVSAFADRIGDFGLVYDALVVPAAWAIILLELLAGCALAVNWRGGLGLVILLLGLFLGVLVYAIRLGIDVDCGCFGPGLHVRLRTQLLIDLGLVLWCGVVYWSQRRCCVRTVGPYAVSLRSGRRGKPIT